MAANYWDSTQRRYWQFTKEQLGSMRKELDDEDPALVQMFQLPPLRHLYIYFNQQINRLGKRLGVRQQALATAQMYLKRFYIKVEIRRTNPYLVMATAVYLACKMEECPQHIRLVVTEARSLWPDFLGLDTSKLGECEFFMISELNSQLIIHQPYRTLTSLQADLLLSAEEVALAWSVINDSYMTDLPLLYPPHVIALTAILLGLVCKPNSNPVTGSGQPAPNAQGSTAQGGTTNSNPSMKATASQAQAALTGGSGSIASGTQMSPSAANGPARAAMPGAKDKAPQKVTRFASWLADSNVDIEAVVDSTQELISFYEAHEHYSDKLAREQITRFIKARGLDK